MTFEPGDWIEADDLMQQGYAYQLAAPPGEDFSAEFAPFFSPKQMLELGVFEGKYLNDCREEFPASWYGSARLGEKPDPSLNCFSVKSRQSLSVWQEKGWIVEPGPRGWFQWYCRYYLGRRLEGVDAFQIKRWRSFARHAGQIRANCMPGDLACRPRQRQALLQWSYDPWI